jgi:hypothetical protein
MEEIMNARTALVAAAVALLVLTAAPVSAAPMLNPSFETGDFTGWAHSWFAVRSGGESNATHGLYYVASDPNRDAALSQSFSLPSDSLQLKFDTSYILVNDSYTARLFGVGNEANYIDLLAGSNQGLGFFGGRYWSRYTVNVASLAGQDVTVQFLVDQGTGNPPVLIDNLQLILAPEPMTGLLLAGGAGWVAIRRRRGRR